MTLRSSLKDSARGEVSKASKPAKFAVYRDEKLPKTSQFWPDSLTMAPVFGLGNIGRRCVESVVGLFAVLGFLYVPLGRHTGFEHAKAVLSTPAASAAVDDFTTTALALRERALELVTGRSSAEGEGSARVEAEPSKPAPVKAHGSQPRAVPPKLK
jgi:hypothetical protein